METSKLRRFDKSKLRKYPPSEKKNNFKIFGVVSRPVPEGLDSMNNNRLRRIIKDLLQKKRYLIVLDDMWRLDVWDALKYALPKNKCGSRVMLTTRNADVASTSGVESIGKVYNLNPLPPMESWYLFCNKTFQGDACPSYLEEICKNILRKCEGLPSLGRSSPYKRTSHKY
jgi:disease resistance protein RPM1